MKVNLSNEKAIYHEKLCNFTKFFNLICRIIQKLLNTPIMRIEEKRKINKFILNIYDE